MQVSLGRARLRWPTLLLGAAEIALTLVTAWPSKSDTQVSVVLGFLLAALLILANRAGDSLRMTAIVAVGAVCMGLAIAAGPHVGPSIAFYTLLVQLAFMIYILLRRQSPRPPAT